MSFSTFKPGDSQRSGYGRRERFSSPSCIKRSPPRSTATFADRAWHKERHARRGSQLRLAFPGHPGVVHQGNTEWWVLWFNKVTTWESVAVRRKWQLSPGLSLDDSVVKVSRKSKPTATTSITNIEQWTTAFTSYMSVLIHKFPTRWQELLQFVSLIRYAARAHKGLAWPICDLKFRQKASVYKSLGWSAIDNQLLLTIFTVLPAVLNEEYPLFSQGP